MHMHREHETVNISLGLRMCVSLSLCMMYAWPKPSRMQKKTSLDDEYANASIQSTSQQKWKNEDQQLGYNVVEGAARATKQWKFAISVIAFFLGIYFCFFHFLFSSYQKVRDFRSHFYQFESPVSKRQTGKNDNKFIFGTFCCCCGCMVARMFGFNWIGIGTWMLHFPLAAAYTTLAIGIVFRLANRGFFLLVHVIFPTLFPFFSLPSVLFLLKFSAAIKREKRIISNCEFFLFLVE